MQKILLNGVVQFFTASTGELIRSSAAENGLFAVAFVPDDYEIKSIDAYEMDGRHASAFDFDDIKNHAQYFGFYPDIKNGTTYYKTQPMSREYVFDALTNKTKEEAIQLVSAIGTLTEDTDLVTQREAINRKNAAEISERPLREFIGNNFFFLSALVCAALFYGESK